PAARRLRGCIFVRYKNLRLHGPEPYERSHCLDPASHSPQERLGRYDRGMDAGIEYLRVLFPSMREFRSWLLGRLLRGQHSLDPWRAEACPPSCQPPHIRNPDEMRAPDSREASKESSSRSAHSHQPQVSV